MSDSDDDLPQLSDFAQAALQEFLQDQKSLADREQEILQNNADQSEDAVF